MVGKTTLTEKEKNILIMTAAGLDRKQMAVLLGCTVSNVDKTIQRIQKYAVTTGLVNIHKSRNVMNLIPLFEKFNAFEKAEQLREGFYTELEYEQKKLKRKKRVA